MKAIESNEEAYLFPSNFQYPLATTTLDEHNLGQLTFQKKLFVLLCARHSKQLSNHTLDFRKMLLAMLLTQENPLLVTAKHPSLPADSHKQLCAR